MEVRTGIDVVARRYRAGFEIFLLDHQRKFLQCQAKPPAAAAALMDATSKRFPPS